MSKLNWPEPRYEMPDKEKQSLAVDPFKEHRASIHPAPGAFGLPLFQDDVWDASPIQPEPRRETSDLFKQVIADTRAQLKRIGEIK